MIIIKRIDNKDKPCYITANSVLDKENWIGAISLNCLF